MRPLLGIGLVTTSVLFTMGCGDAASDADSSERNRTLTVHVSTVDGWDVAGATITATLDEHSLEDVFHVPLESDTDITGVTGETCQEAQERAQHYVDTFEMVAGECEPRQREATREIESLTATVDEHGDVVFHVLDGSYDVYGAIEIVAGDDGCHFSGAVTAPPDAVEATLALDSNTCE